MNIPNDTQTIKRHGTSRTTPEAQEHQTDSSTHGQPTQQVEKGSAISIARGRLTSMAQIGEDWLYLALLGIIMALLSFSMDSIITLFLNTRLWFSSEMRSYNLILQYVAWCATPILLVTFSTGFVHLCSPTAIGSGIPEMKTILRGVVLNEYLTFRTLIAKIVGLTFTLGSGLPLGKEGPFVHMASIVATLLSKLVASFQGIYENESRTSEMLSAACAVGVAATFYAPIGGVLFSIEVTTVYFAVRNYWRGFFAACCGATIWRLLGFWVKNDESISALFKTNFSTDYPFDPIELLVFSFIGASCGLMGAAYIKFHRDIVQFFRRHKGISTFLQKNRFVYPILVTLVITSVTFPPFLGKYTASTLSTHTTIEHLFSNRTWSLGNQDIVSKRILDHWTTATTSFHLHLVLYIIMLFWTSALASTIPIPSGLFIPVLKMGAAYGRLLGELMAQAYPDGIKYREYGHTSSIVPGSYAVVGAAALSGAVTHTISTSVILFEMTGQIVHIIPVILGVLISNAVCQSLQPSIYDSIIEIKKLPYLPPIASSNSVSHRILVKDFMNTNLAYVWKERCTYADLKALLAAHKKIISFPLVESPQSMKLLGSVARPDLLKLLYMHLGRERRLQEVCRRNSDTLAPAIQLLSTISGKVADEQNSKKYPDRHPLELTHRSIIDTKDNGLEMSINKSPSAVSTPSSSSVSDYGGLCTGKYLENLNEDSARLVVSATRPSSYGATSNNKVNTSTFMKQSGSTNLLNECQKESDSDQEDDKHTGVAKIINHYNRGTSMEEDLLDRSIQEVENQLARASKSPEIVVVVSVKQPSPTTTTTTATNTIDDKQNIEHKNSDCSAVSMPEMDRRSSFEPTILNRESTASAPETVQRKSSDPVEQLKPNSSFNQVFKQSPSLSTRPTKSILKSSSTTGNFGHMAKRNISSQSFAGTFGLPSKQFAPRLDDVQKKEPTARFAIGGELPDELSITKHRRKVRLPRLRVVDMTPEEQEQWEKEQLNAFIDISLCHIDEAPFQLVEQTSLYRVHTLFSMLGLNHAYVTSFGRLVGIVALKDIRYALEKMLQDK